MSAVGAMASANKHSWDYYEPVGNRLPIQDRAAAEEDRACPKRQPLPDVLSSRWSKSMRFTPGYAMPSVGELLYFPIRARAEPVRMIAHYAGLAYSMRTVDFEEWATLKETVPGGVLPCFEPCVMDDVGEMFGETVEIAKHFAQQADTPGLCPTDAAGAALAEKLFLAAMDNKLNQVNPLLCWFPAEEAKPKVAGAVKEVVAELKKLESDLKHDSAGPFFGGASPIWGEFAIFAVVDALTKLDGKALGTLGAPWKAFHEAMSSLRGVKEYLKIRPKAGCGKVGRPGSIIYTQSVDA